MRIAPRSLFHRALSLSNGGCIAAVVLFSVCLVLCHSATAQRPNYVPPEGYPSWVAVPPIDAASLQPTKVVDTCEEIKEALRNAVPGDVIMVRNGTYSGGGGDFRIISASGTPERPITLMAEEPGKVTFAEGDNWGIMWIYGGVSYWRIVGIRFVATWKREHGLLMFGCSNITFQDCEVTGSVKRGVLVQSDSASPAHHLVFSGLYLHDVENGIQVGVKDQTWTQHVLIENCHAERIYGSGCDGIIVENKLSQDILVRDCVANNNADAGFDVKPNARIIRCIAHHNGKSGFKMWRGCEIVNCLSYANGGYAFQLIGNSENVPYTKSMLNCTGAGWYGMQVGAFGGLYMRNCIIDGSIAMGVSALDVDYCLFTRDPGTWKGEHSIVGNPMFVDPTGGNYRLQEGSPAIDAGTFLLQATPDLLMKRRQQPYDMGCFEFDARLSNQPPTAPEVDLIPDRPTTNDDLSCIITIPSQDPDGDQVAYRYRWYKNGELQPDQTGSTLDHNLTAKGETWKCVVVPTDGVANGPSAGASEKIVNSPPHVRWANATGSDVSPAVPGPFTFRVVVEDADGTEPQVMRVHVERLEDGRKWCEVASPGLSLRSGEWEAGALCEASTTLPNGVLRSRVEVKDDEGAWGVGDPTQWIPGPVMDAPPQLWVTCRPELTSGFVTPTTGIANETLFVFAALYTDAEGDYPVEHKLEIQRKNRDGIWVTYKSDVAHERSRGPLSGQLYFVKRRLPKGEYRFRFVFADPDGEATGTDSRIANGTQWQEGLLVSDLPAKVASTSGLTITSLLATPTQLGAQISFALSSKADVSVRLLNIAGREVRSFGGVPGSRGLNTVLWDGRSNTGTPAPAGQYLVEVTATSAHGDRAKVLAPLHLIR